MVSWSLLAMTLTCANVVLISSSRRLFPYVDAIPRPVYTHHGRSTNNELRASAVTARSLLWMMMMMMMMMMMTMMIAYKIPSLATWRKALKHLLLD